MANVLVIGNGGREHALAWGLRRSKKVDKIFYAPGENAGMDEIAESINCKLDDFEGLANSAEKNNIDLTVVGPEKPLVDGIIDYFNSRGLKIFGPNKRAAILEGSKVFAKEFMRKYNIPTADFEIFSNLKDKYGNMEDAIHYLQKIDWEKSPKVIKADGLAAGKGAIVPESKKEAIEKVKLIMEKKHFGEAGNRIVIEDRLFGQETSFIAFYDGKTVKSMVTSQDHKPVYDGDKGPNTGGMGAYSPAPITYGLEGKIMSEIMIPVGKKMKKEDREFKGVLYAGLMIEDKKPKVLEFNVRYGDPEHQVIMPRLNPEKSDFYDISLSCIDGNLDKTVLEWYNNAVCCVILASKGYPGNYEKGKWILGLDKARRKSMEKDNALVFFAGAKKVKRSKGSGYVPDLYQTNGGRVLGLTGIGRNIKEAIEKAYKYIPHIYFQDDYRYYRKDIGQKALELLKCQDK